MKHVWGTHGRTLAGAFLVFALTACEAREAIPTYELERRPFRHRVTAEGTLKSEQTTQLSVPPEVRAGVRLAWVATDGSLVEEGDVIARFDPSPMEERLEQGLSSLESAELEVDKTEIENDLKLTEIDTSYEVADLELVNAERFRKTDTSVFSRQEVIEDQIDEQLASERKQNAENAKVQQRSLGRTELDLLAIKRRKANQAIDQARQGLEALEVRAPHPGLLTLIRWQGEPLEVGIEMWQGQKIGEIPDLSTMEAEVFVLESDAGGLEVGKPAKVVVEADPGTAYEATIKRIDSVAKPRFRGSPVQYFGVTLALAETIPATMKPGQRVRATLMLAELDDALVVPRQAVDQNGGERRVFVRNGNGFSARPVEIGASTMGLLVVTEGLSEGEVIALRPPEDAEVDTEAGAG